MANKLEAATSLRVGDIVTIPDLGNACSWLITNTRPISVAHIVPTPDGRGRIDTSHIIPEPGEVYVQGRWAVQQILAAMATNYGLLGPTAIASVQTAYNQPPRELTGEAAPDTVVCASFTGNGLLDTALSERNELAVVRYRSGTPLRPEECAALGAADAAVTMARQQHDRNRAD